MAGAAANSVLGFGIGELGEVLLVDGHGHFDHYPGAILPGVGVGGEVEAACCRAFGVAVVALDAKGACELAHYVYYLISGEVFGKHLKIGGRGPRMVRSALIVCGDTGRRRACWCCGLSRGSQRDGHCEQGGERGENGRTKLLRHPVVPLLERRWKQLHLRVVRNLAIKKGCVYREFPLCITNL